MSDYLHIIDELTACIEARTPLVILDTEERDRARDALAEAARGLNTDIDFYTDCEGFVELRRGERTCDVSDPLGFIEETLKKKSGGVFALGDVRFLDADNAFSRKMAGLIRLAAFKKCTIVIITPDPIWGGLNKLGMYLKLDLPSRQEREKILSEFLSHKKIKMDKDKVGQAAAMLSGYSALQLNTVLSFVHKMKGGFTYENLCAVATQKNKLFGKIPSIGKIEVGDVHVAGLDGIKEWLSRKQKIFFATEEELNKKHLRSPKGVLLVGVPGCGKSLSARLIARSWQLPLYRFDIGALFDKYVGESEKNMRIALDYIESVSPCVLWIDEIEKEFFGGDNDTAKRILGSFLYWLQEFSGKVFLVATANDVTQMPPELFRKGRFSETFFVDLPDENERKAAIELYAGLSLTMEVSEAEVDELVRLSEGFSYADIEAAIKHVAEFEFISGEKESFNALKRTFASAVGIMQAQRELIDKTRQWGLNAVPASGKRR